MIDLAGSEKVSKTGATGITLKEAQYTNRSLTTLGMVIRSITENSPHIPFRDSKLTRILADSLGGNSKTCLIVTCNPIFENMEETVSSIRFGTTVKTIKNTPQQNVVKSLEEYKRLLDIANKKLSKMGVDLTENKLNQLLEKENLDLKAEIKRYVTCIDNLQASYEEKENEIELLTKKLEEQEKLTNVSEYHLKLLKTKQETIKIQEEFILNLERSSSNLRNEIIKLKSMILKHSQKNFF